MEGLWFEAAWVQKRATLMNRNISAAGYSVSSGSTKSRSLSSSLRCHAWIYVTRQSELHLELAHFYFLLMFHIILVCKSSSIITHSTRTKRSSPNAAMLLLLPLIISSISTPKLYTSAFFVSWPNMAYSGARYPLKKQRWQFRTSRKWVQPEQS